MYSQNFVWFQMESLCKSSFLMLLLLKPPNDVIRNFAICTDYFTIYFNSSVTEVLILTFALQINALILI